jgi:hypothetical protein
MNGANNHMHSDSNKRISSFLVALLFAAGDVRRVCRAWHAYCIPKNVPPVNFSVMARADNVEPGSRPHPTH